MIHYAELDSLRAALAKLDELEAIVDDGCYSEDAERAIERLRSLFMRDLNRIERTLLARQVTA
jgi:hypothetical protein